MKDLNKVPNKTHFKSLAHQIAEATGHSKGGEFVKCKCGRKLYSPNECARGICATCRGGYGASSNRPKF